MSYYYSILLLEKFVISLKPFYWSLCNDYIFKISIEQYWLLPSLSPGSPYLGHCFPTGQFQCNKASDLLQIQEFSGIQDSQSFPIFFQSSAILTNIPPFTSISLSYATIHLPHRCTTELLVTLPTKVDTCGFSPKSKWIGIYLNNTHRRRKRKGAEEKGEDFFFCF